MSAAKIAPLIMIATGNTTSSRTTMMIPPTMTASVAVTIEDMSKPVGPYTPAIRAGNTLYISGQLGLVDGALVDGLDAQVRQAVRNLAALVEAEGGSLDNIVKTTVLLDSIDYYADMNAAYTESFGDHRPARAAFAVEALPLGAMVEIEAIAVLA
jgi:2-iminobutanoate/2-iminopropanoate deaminase